MTETLQHVVILNDFSEARGGATSLAMLAAKLLRERGLHVTFISGDGGHGAALRALGVEHFALGGTKLTPEQAVMAGLKGLWNASFKQRIESLLTEIDTKHTVYHLHGWQKILSPSVFAALRGIRERLVLHAHDFFLVCPNGTFMDFPRKRVCHRTPLSLPCLTTDCDRRRPAHKVYRVLRQVVQNQASGLPLGDANILLVHPAMRSYFARAGVPDQSMFSVLNPAMPLCTERVRAERNRTFFYVGRIEPEKGPREFAEAVRQARVEACMVGEGSLAAELQQDFPEIRMVGWCNRAELSSLVSSARCLVMPSQLPEPFGLIAAEAAQSGLPVLASQHAFLAGDLERVGAGLALPTDPSDFAGLVERVATDDALVHRMSIHGFERAKQLSATHESWCEELLGHYQRVLGQAHGRVRGRDEDSAAQCQI